MTTDTTNPAPSAQNNTVIVILLILAVIASIILFFLDRFVAAWQSSDMDSTVAAVNLASIIFGVILVFVVPNVSSRGRFVPIVCGIYGILFAVALCLTVSRF